MVSAITAGVRINVEVYYQKDYSKPLDQDFLFAYKITITNENNFPIQLLRRTWQIFDSNGTYKNVTGDGVVGEQPIIQPNEAYSYVSGCNIKTDMGSMHGNYEMMNLFNKSLFKVAIPKFNLLYPYKQN